MVTLVRIQVPPYDLTMLCVYKRMIGYMISFVLFLGPSIEALAKKDKKSAKRKLDLSELVLPSEVSGVGQKGGSIFYSKTVKDKVLMPTHFWGEIGVSGLHYMPLDTTLIDGLSLAGGPKGSPLLDEITVIRKKGQEMEKITFDIESGGDDDAHKFKLRPGDTVYVPKSTFQQDRAYYTSLISVAITILSGVLIYRQVRDIKKFN